MKDFFVHQEKNESITIGGVSSLMDFSADEISVRVKGGYIIVQGEKLVIQRFDENEITVIGKIREVSTNVGV